MDQFQKKFPLDIPFTLPPKVLAIEKETKKLDFSMACEHATGSLLRTLAASKPRGRFLELGTGTGLSTCWILDGMDKNASLVTVDNSPEVVEVAKRHLGLDSRVEFFVSDGSVFMNTLAGNKYDFIFADTWPGKYWDLELALALVADGGFYIVDDMLPQDNWPPEHGPKVVELAQRLHQNEDFFVSKLDWATGIIVATKKFPIEN